MMGKLLKGIGYLNTFIGIACVGVFLNNNYGEIGYAFAMLYGCIVFFGPAIISFGHKN